MAYFNCEFPDDFLKDLNKLSNYDDVCRKILSESVPIIEDSLKKTIRSSHVKTGDLWKSIKGFEPWKSKKDGIWKASACPTGRARGKMKSGKVYKRSKHGTMTRGKAIYNNDKLWFLEYGTSKQEPSPVIEKAIKQAKSKVYEKMQETFNKEVGT